MVFTWFALFSTIRSIILSSYCERTMHKPTSIQYPHNTHTYTTTFVAHVEQNIHFFPRHYQPLLLSRHWIHLNANSLPSPPCFLADFSRWLWNDTVNASWPCEQLIKVWIKLWIEIEFFVSLLKFLCFFNKQWCFCCWRWCGRTLHHLV